MNGLLTALKRVLTPKRYRIIHDPALGYCAQVKDWHGWWGIRGNANAGVADYTCLDFPQLYFVPTEAEAGERINRHATSRGQKIVWQK